MLYPRIDASIFYRILPQPIHLRFQGVANATSRAAFNEAMETPVSSPTYHVRRDSGTSVSPLRPIVREPTSRPRFSIENIQAGLGLTESTYRDFYVVVADVMTRLGYVGKTFRSCKDQKRIRLELATEVLAAHETKAQFPGMEEAIRTTKGQEAFMRMVYRVGANFRRPKKVLARQRMSRSHSGGSVKEEPSVGPVWGADGKVGWDLVVRVTNVDNGVRLPICRVKELARGWPHSRSFSSGTVDADELVFDRFLEKIEADIGFERGLHSLGWEEAQDGPSVPPTTIQKASHWTTAVTHMLGCGRTREFLDFTVWLSASQRHKNMP